MTHIQFIALALAFVLTQAGNTARADDFDPSPIIESLGLRSADTPVSKVPGWAPRKVVVGMFGAYPEIKAHYLRALERAAGNVEIVIAERGSFKFNAESLADVDGVIGMCTPPLLQQASDKLRWIHNYSVGMDLCKGATEAQLEHITFTNNKRLSGPPIAEHTIAMLLALTRQIPASVAAQQENQWGRLSGADYSFGELSGKTLLVVGLGGIGTEVARRAHGLGMRVIATRNSSRSGPDFVEYVGLSDELFKLAGQADVVVNALPLTAATTGVFDKAFFEAVKPGAIFLSVGRGKSTVTADLITALESGQLWGAGLDVTDPEPLPADSPLWGMDNVLITPHVAAASRDSIRRSMVIAAENLRRYVAGEPMLNVVDLRSGY